MMIKLPDQIKKKNHFIFPELWPFENLGFLEFVSKISQKLFELGDWNPVSW